MFVAKPLLAEDARELDMAEAPRAKTYVNSIKMEFIFCPAGTFMMGAARV